MKSILRSAILLGGLLCCSTVFAQDQGETLFKQTCSACHTINGGKLLGPDLAGIHTRRDEAWLIRFVQSSQSLIASGDADAVALFEEYNKLPMPDHTHSDDDVRAILRYIASQSPADGTPVDEATPDIESPAEVTEEAVQRGRDLFVGRIPFQNGGAPCNACHHATTDAVMTGGSLAKDLTTAFSRLSGAGVQAMMSNPPFPVMRVAFEDKALTEDEIADLVAFLQVTDSQHQTQVTGNYGRTLLLAGLIGFAVLLGFFAFLGMSRTKRTVNHEIYARQIKSA
ncbi:MAG: c-type cytochrome [Rhodothermales bacterium]